MNIREIFRKYKIAIISTFIILVLLILGLLVFMLTRGDSDSPDRTLLDVVPIPSFISEPFKESSRGDSLEEISKNLKNPIETEDNKQYYYSSEETIPNEATLENGKVTFFKEYLPREKGQEKFLEVFSNTTQVFKTIYGQEAENGTYLYVSNNSGVAYLAHPDSGTIFEIWYFEPVEFDEFKSKWANDYYDSLEEFEQNYEHFE